MNARWTIDDMPYLAGKTFVVTGANSGIGMRAARGLAGAGANVVMACRNRDKARDARDHILARHPDAELSIVPLDLADLDSVREAAETIKATHERIDVLVNNAGVMGAKGKTAQGFEMAFGVNHLGHFALTGLLLDRISGASDRGRVVTVASLAHIWFGRIRWRDIMHDRWWSAWPTYGQSKLANLMFSIELNRRLEEADRPTIAVACHPGMSNTEIAAAGKRTNGSRIVAAIMRAGTHVVTQSPSMGALPTLFAATHPEVAGGDYIGPGGPLEVAGYPQAARIAGRARREEETRRLWDLSVELTGVDYGGLGG